MEKKFNLDDITDVYTTKMIRNLGGMGRLQALTKEGKFIFEGETIPLQFKTDEIIAYITDNSKDEYTIRIGQESTKGIAQKDLLKTLEKLTGLTFNYEYFAN